MTRSAEHGALDGVITGLRRRGECDILRALFQANVPALIPELPHNEAMDGAVMSFGSSGLCIDVENELLARLYSENVAALTGDLKPVIAIRDDVDDPRFVRDREKKKEEEPHTPSSSR